MSAGHPSELRARKPTPAMRAHLADARFHLLNAELALERAVAVANTHRERDYAQKAMSYARRLRRAMPRPSGGRRRPTP